MRVWISEVSPLSEGVLSVVCGTQLIVCFAGSEKVADWATNASSQVACALIGRKQFPNIKFHAGLLVPTLYCT
jgi:hypothetical protein